MKLSLKFDTKMQSNKLWQHFSCRKGLVVGQDYSISTIHQPKSTAMSSSTYSLHINPYPFEATQSKAAKSATSISVHPTAPSSVHNRFLWLWGNTPNFQSVKFILLCHGQNGQDINQTEQLFLFLFDQFCLTILHQWLQL